MRYVNARFINNAAEEISIFPDRGARREKGYSLEAKSSTLLEFVLMEGAIPYGMDFSIKLKLTGKPVLLQNRNEWLHVDSSDDQQVVTEIDVSPGTLYHCILNGF